VTASLKLVEEQGRPEPLLTAAEVAKIVNVPAKRVYELGIPVVRISQRSLRWRPSDVERWIEERRGT
jgi:predicted DNA-binding transcriptional regulator AlpA